MDRIVATTHYQYELIDMASFMPPAYRFVTLGHDVVDPADKLGCKVEEFEDVSIYGLSEDVFRRCDLGLERVNRIDRGAEALSPAVLMSIVATFDSNIADLVRDMISLKPALLNAGIKTVPVSEVLKSGSLDEIKDRILMVDGAGCLPAPRQQGVQFAVPGGARHDTFQHVGQPGHGIDLVQPCGLDQRCDNRPMPPAAIGTGKQCIFAPESYCPFILPMSGRNWKSITRGIPISGARFLFGAWSKEQPASLCWWRGRPASLSPSQAGCLIPSHVRRWQWARRALIWRRCWN
jgi:hypothetical protein